MNMREPERRLSAQENAIGDQNVERLLTNAYQPETLDSEFVQRVRVRACAALKDRREVISLPADATGSD